MVDPKKNVGEGETTTEFTEELKTFFKTHMNGKSPATSSRPAEPDLKVRPAGGKHSARDLDPEQMLTGAVEDGNMKLS